MVMTSRVEELPVSSGEPAAPAAGEYQMPKGMWLLRAGIWLTGWVFPTAVARLAYRLFATPRYRARHRVSDELLESARIFEVMYGGQLLKAYEWGEGTRTALLVHGWESRGTGLRSFVPGLLEQGWRVVAFDGPAHGDSPGKRTNLVHFAGAVRAVIRHVGGVDAVIAHSFGGASTVFALAHSRPPIEVGRLVLIGAPASTLNVVRGVMDQFSVPRPARRKFIELMQGKLKGIPLEEVELANLAPKVRISEVLIVHDREDPVVPFSSAQTIHQSFEKARLLVPRGLGHYRLMKHPAVIERVVHFVTA